MAIRIKDYSEPLAGPPNRKKLSDWPPMVFAGSEALRVLVAEMDRHCNRTIAGRSFLIGGSRGSGKTTLAKAAIDKVTDLHRERASAENRSQGERMLPHFPLYVHLHGKVLFREHDVLDPKSSLRDLDPNLKEIFLSLRALTIALHLAFMTRLGWSFEQRVADAPDLGEIAAQLRINLDRAVELRDLRWAWKKASVLSNGVLRRGEDISPQKHYSTSQGMLDLVATANVMEAFARAVAKVDDKEGSKAESKQSMEQEHQKAEHQKELLNSIVGIVAGGAAGVGVGMTNPALGALTFILTAALGTLALNFVSKKTFSRSQTKERNVTWDSSITSLEVILPHTINRIRDAGLTPIFVIDELDKVERVDERLSNLMSYLKHIIADDAFFCFLVGRQYFEKLQSGPRNTPARKEYSFFRERLFAVVQPADWHRYLRARLHAEAADAKEKGQSELDRLGLEYVLLARGRMYALEVARELEALPTVSGGDHERIVDIAPGQLTALPMYRNLILMQAIVEYLLDDPQIIARAKRHPGFLQTAYDALYYLLRQWEQKKTPVIEPSAIEDYLNAQRHTEDHDERRPAAVRPLIDGLDD